MKYIEDVLFLIGVGLLGYGVFLVFGQGWSFICVGTILTAITTLSALKNNDSKPTVEHEKQSDTEPA